MIELINVAEFSRCHCVSICAFLLPANLLITSATMLLTAVNRPSRIINTTAGLAIFPALLMLLHVMSWWAIGVVMLPTYILPLLAVTCLAINTYAMVNPERMGWLLKKIGISIANKYQQVLNH